MIFSRPFEHVPSEKLASLYAEAVKQYDYHTSNHWVYLAKDFKRLMNQYGRELRKRKDS